MKTFFKSLFAIITSFIVAILILSIAIGVLVGIGVTSLSYTQEPIERGTLLEIDLNEKITESPQSESLLNLRNLNISSYPSLSLLETLRLLEIAATDPNITALSLRLDSFEDLPLAMAEELRTALDNFREMCGKPIYAYAERYSQSDIYLASVADKIYIHPMGAVDWQGIATTTLFYGDLLKELNIGVDVFRPSECRYKSAVEPYTRSSMSEESKQQSQRLVDELWRGVVEQLSAARNIPKRELRSLAVNKVVIEALEAKEVGFVSGVLYEDKYEDKLESAGIIREDDALRKITLANYALTKPKPIDNLADDKIAIIYMDGVIVDGDSNRQDGLVGSRTLVEQLREARYDDDIKGVVLRVNSPGGSALAADVIWREVSLLKEEKPVVVSMGSYAASGGYYVSAPADLIIADRYSVTGSIGVYGMVMNFESALNDKLHITIDGAKSSPSADFGRSPRPLNGVERRAMLRSVDDIYSQFTDIVSEGRNLPIGVVHTLAGGQVWSGVEAESCGLVDGIGGLKVALGVLIERCSLLEGEYRVVEIEAEQSPLDVVLSYIGVFATPIERYLRDRGLTISHIRNLQTGVVALEPINIK